MDSSHRHPSLPNDPVWRRRHRRTAGADFQPGDPSIVCERNTWHRAVCA